MTKHGHTNQRTPAQIRASAQTAAGYGDLEAADRLHAQADQLEKERKQRATIRKS